MSWLLVAPAMAPIAIAIIAFLLRDRGGLAAKVSIAGSALYVLIAVVLFAHVWREGTIAATMGGWPPPFGIAFAADLLSAMMVVITAITALAIAIYALADIDEKRERLGYHALFNMLIGGVSGAFLTGDIFNLYVWFEVMLIASFGLLTLGGTKQQLDGGLKYIALNLVSTVLFLTAIGLLYGVTGTLNMADLRGAVASTNDTELMTLIAVLFIAAFGIKSAAFPLFFWLPASYHTPPFAVSAVFAGLLTKVGVYALIRVFTLIFVGDVAFTHTILLWIAAFTMATGVLGAACQTEIRKILSFHIISQIGYMILGLALYTPLAIAGAIFYLAHHIIVKANLFLIGGVIRRMTGSEKLASIGGLYAASPLLAVLFFIPAFSLAGFPPLSGFWAKFLVIKASLDASQYVIAFVALATGVLTVFSMTKIWAAAFWKPHPGGDAAVDVNLSKAEWRAYFIPIIGLATMTILIGIFPEPFVIMAERIAAELLDPSDYVNAVLGATR